MKNAKGDSLTDGFKSLRGRGWQHCVHLENPAGEGGAEPLRFILTFVYQNAHVCSGQPSGRLHNEKQAQTIDKTINHKANRYIKAWTIQRGIRLHTGSFDRDGPA